ncbi:MAG: 3-isopropylmalate dehydratase large subunit [Chloroflexi bacterium]|jgi:3-isopropylmalate/(R)-2-methylmalate dehydratase large subunit|nr:3-isopropylmalate dehydratase large subunit [Chloroflexota bacterium]MBT4002097.1 3-isopropylmalate dehydratase large subunit [Chloroflexota bacterium]MBT4533492.1 3-isopropylmalate dehydratase large subunit [Chloroflexota bacterium]MBT4681865.1 3-isopropylmalate dehydratase large subunit [Chloroflexota bacterium]MBT4756260.1 3-isopropylmalate dehydratase large subunit [Chloroflexota bacterium]
MNIVKPKTLFDKVWERHIVSEEADSPTILYIDLHLIHEVTSPQAFSGLRQREMKVRRPDKTLGVMDHSTPTISLLESDIIDNMSKIQMDQMAINCKEFGIKLYEFGSPDNGIVHVVAPEKGVSQPGMTIVCGDSHTSTHGAFGALAFGIGTSEVEHVLGSQCLLQYKPKSYEVRVDGKLKKGVTAKDIILTVIAKIGTGGGTGHVFEFTGSAIRSLSMEERMTICNMSIEGGARAGMVAPDETTFEYLKGKEFSPKGEEWETAVENWKSLTTDEGAIYDAQLILNAEDIEPMVTYGTNPGMGIQITESIPYLISIADPDSKVSTEKALDYMGISPGKKIMGHPIDVVFLGSCTNSRISDLRQAAEILKDRKVADSVRMLVVPGSQLIKKQAEAEGLDIIFKAAGAEWREAGCSMCLAMNGDQLSPGQYAVSTSNRNFEGRQGKGGRTFLASPLTAAASAIAGKVADARGYL